MTKVLSLTKYLFVPCWDETSCYLQYVSISVLHKPLVGTLFFTLSNLLCWSNSLYFCTKFNFTNFLSLMVSFPLIGLCSKPLLTSLLLVVLPHQVPLSEASLLVLLVLFTRTTYEYSLALLGFFHKHTSLWVNNHLLFHKGVHHLKLSCSLQFYPTSAGTDLQACTSLQIFS